MCHLSTKDQYVCQSNHRIAEAVTGVLGGTQFSAGPFYHPRSSRGRFGHPREAVVGAGNFPDSNGISDDFKRQNRSHQTEPVPACSYVSKILYSRQSSVVGLRSPKSCRCTRNPEILSLWRCYRLQSAHEPWSAIACSSPASN